MVQIVTVEAGKLLRLELLERQRLRSAEHAIDQCSLRPIAAFVATATAGELRRSLLSFLRVTIPS